MWYQKYQKSEWCSTSCFKHLYIGKIDIHEYDDIFYMASLSFLIVVVKDGGMRWEYRHLFFYYSKLELCQFLLSIPLYFSFHWSLYLKLKIWYDACNLYRSFIMSCVMCCYKRENPITLYSNGICVYCIYVYFYIIKFFIF